MYEHDSLASPVVSHSLGRGIALLRWGGFWSAICLPLLHVPLLLVSGLSPSTTPVLLALWAANLAALVLGRQHSPRTTDSGGDHR
ncbi:hypothetical protein [Salinigranum sp.]|uniref:hypothetical protein n=1 Tax=Salinigranum sp. TaxID=1966351 RepID=UPI00356405A0